MAAEDTTKPTETQLEEGKYIRAQLFESDKSDVRRYADLVVGEDAGYWSLLKYELLTCLLGGVRGALGLWLRKKFYPRLFKRCGRGVVFGRNLTIRNAKNITLGDRVVIDDECVLDARGAGPEGVTIGSRVILGRGVSVQAKIGPISIGDDCDIGMHSDVHAQGGVRIGKQVVLGGGGKLSGGIFQIDRPRKVADGASDAAGGHQSEREQTRQTRGPIVLGDRALIGMGSMFLDGVEIGEGAVIGAGSVCTKSIPDYAVAAGTPCKVIRMRETRDAATIR